GFVPAEQPHEVSRRDLESAKKQELVANFQTSIRGGRVGTHLPDRIVSLITLIGADSHTHQLSRLAYEVQPNLRKRFFVRRRLNAAHIAFEKVAHVRTGNLGNH